MPDCVGFPAQVLVLVKYKQVKITSVNEVHDFVHNKETVFSLLRFILLWRVHHRQRQEKIPINIRNWS